MGGLSSTSAIGRLTDSGNLTFPVGGALTTWNHGLGVIPKMVTVSIVCITAEHGYEIGEEVPILTAEYFSTNFQTVSFDATAVRFVAGAGFAVPVVRKTDFGFSWVTPANWKLRIRAGA